MSTDSAGLRLLILLATLLLASCNDKGSSVERGRYLTAIMDCATCHTDGAFIGKPDEKHPLAGSTVAHSIAGLGTFWPPNLTPDRSTGLGAWSENDIIKAIRTGERPDGRVLAPAMPWRAYAALDDHDARSIARYLKSLPATKSQVRPPESDQARPNTPVVSVSMPEPK